MLDWNCNKYCRIIKGDKMVKAEIIESPEVSKETELIATDMFLMLM